VPPFSAASPSASPSAYRPAISVVIPAYNAAPWLSAALDSISAQTFTNLEIIVIDDGSTDDTPRILRRHAASDSRLRVISRPNTGIVGALNDGLAAARVDFIARMDADDLAAPDRLSRQIACLAPNPDCVALGSAVWFIDPRDAVLDYYAPPLDHASIEEQLLLGNGGALIHPALLLRRAAVLQIGGYRPAYDRAEDLDLCLRLARVGRLANIPAPLLRYRLHPASTNFTHRAQQRALALRAINEARLLRDLPLLAPADLAPAPADISLASRHRGWAVSALRWGRRSTAIRHALLAVKAEPSARTSWQHLRLVCTAPKPSPA
jgi:glycosyltransferase involved in cell wall biosynthesis